MPNNYTVVATEFHGGGKISTHRTLAAAGRAVRARRSRTDCVCGCALVLDSSGHDVTAAALRGGREEVHSVQTGVRVVAGTEHPIRDVLYRDQFGVEPATWCLVRGLCNGVPDSAVEYSTRRAAEQALAVARDARLQAM